MDFLQIFSRDTLEAAAESDDATELEVFRILRMWYPKGGNDSTFLQRIIFYKSFTEFERTCLEVSSNTKSLFIIRFIIIYFLFLTVDANLLSLTVVS